MLSMNIQCKLLLGPEIGWFILYQQLGGNQHYQWDEPGRRKANKFMSYFCLNINYFLFLGGFYQFWWHKDGLEDFSRLAYCGQCWDWFEIIWFETGISSCILWVASGLIWNHLIWNWFEITLVILWFWFEITFCKWSLILSLSYEGLTKWWGSQNGKSVGQTSLFLACPSSSIWAVLQESNFKSVCLEFRVYD